MPRLYKAWNGPMPTTAAQASVATANGVKTMLQLATPSTDPIEIHSWGFSFDVASAGIMTVELLETDVAATVTAHVAAGVQPIHAGDPASKLTLGTSATGYTGTAEGSITATRVFSARKLPIASVGSSGGLAYEYQFTPAERPRISVSKFCRIRVTATTTTPTMLCWICWQE